MDTLTKKILAVVLTIAGIYDIIIGLMAFGQGGILIFGLPGNLVIGVVLLIIGVVLIKRWVLVKEAEVPKKKA